MKLVNMKVGIKMDGEKKKLIYLKEFYMENTQYGMKKKEL
jgi:hypothetical protein